MMKVDWEDSSQKKNQIWDEFLNTWPHERVRRMSLEEYTNLNRSDSFCYWLEKKVRCLGGISGGSAYMFGIYRRSNTTKNDSRKSYLSDGKYAWMLKYGEDRDTAFKTVKGHIIDIIEAALANNLALVDPIDLGDAVKWKITAIYNKRFPISTKPLHWSIW